MIPLDVRKTVRPSKKASTKDTVYDLDMAKFYLGLSHDYRYEAFKAKTWVNRSFASGEQWILAEDLDPFLLDQSGGFRNRVRFIQNIIKPIIRQYVGSAIKTDYSYTVYPSSEASMDRRQSAMNEFLLMDYHSKRMGGIFRDFISSQLPVGDNEFDSAEAFKKTYKDKYVEDMRRLVEFISTEANDIEHLKIELVKRLVTDGICVAYGYERNKNQFFSTLDSIMFLFDRTAKRSDLKDAEFMGDWYYTYPTALFDTVDLNATAKKDLENYARSSHGSSNDINKYFYQYDPGNVPVYRMFWKDIETREFGYVRDEIGNVFYTRVNWEGGKYKSGDLVEAPKYDQHLFKGRKLIKRDQEDLRFCEFIPGYIIGSKSGDIALKHGSYAYQEKSTEDPSTVEFPYKVNIWDYTNGQIHSPIDDVISPQRFINRTLSMGEAQFNSARPGGPIFSRQAVSAGGEKELTERINMGEPVLIDGDMVNNQVGEYRSTYGDGTAVLFNIATHIQSLTQQNTGMNDAMLGNVGGKRELKGVVQSMVERGSLMIEDVFFGLNMVLKNVHQSMLEQGKLIYLGSKQVVMDKNDPLQIASFEIQDDHIRELYRLKIVRTASKDEITAAANMTMIQLFQLGLLDDKKVAALFNNAGNEDISRAMIEYSGEKQVMAEAAAENAQAQAQQQRSDNLGMQNKTMQMQDEQSLRKSKEGIIKELIKKIPKAPEKQNSR